MALNNRNVFSLSSGGWGSEIKAWAGLIASGGAEGESIHCLSPHFWGLLAFLGIQWFLWIPLQSLPPSSHSLVKLFVCLFLVFWSHRAACGILVPLPGIQLAPPAAKGRNLNHWTTREIPHFLLCVALCQISLSFLLGVHLLHLGTIQASQDDLIWRSLTSLYPQRPFSQIRSHSRVLGIRTQMFYCGSPFSPLQVFIP